MSTSLPQGIYTFPLRILSTPTHPAPTHSSYCIVSEKGAHEYVLYGATKRGWQVVQALTGFCARGQLNKDPCTREGALDSTEGHDFVLPAWEDSSTSINVVEKALMDTGVFKQTTHKFKGNVYHKEGTPIYEFRLNPTQVPHQCAQCEKLELDLGANDQRFRRCSSCKEAYYCSEKCQKANWSRRSESHKIECSWLADKNFMYAWELLHKEERRAIMDQMLQDKFGGGFKVISENPMFRIIEKGNMTFID